MFDGFSLSQFAEIVFYNKNENAKIAAKQGISGHFRRVFIYDKGTFVCHGRKLKCFEKAYKIDNFTVVKAFTTPPLHHFGKSFDMILLAFYPRFIPHICYNVSGDKSVRIGYKRRYAAYAER